MRHSLWDLKREYEYLKEQSRRWNFHCISQMDWNVNSDGEPQPPGVSPPPPPPQQRATPSPIDYRSESRRRHDNQDGTVPQSSTSASHDPSQSLMGPPPTHFTGSWPILQTPDIYGEAGRGHHQLPPYSAQQRWGQAHPGYFQTARGQYAFDMKWWAQQKQSMDAYLGGPSWGDDGKSTHPDASLPQWSFGTRVMKNNNPKRPYSNRIGTRAQADMYGGHQYELGQPHHPRSSPSHKRGESGRSSSRGHQYEAAFLGQEANYNPSRHASAPHHPFSRGREAAYDPRRRYTWERRDYRRPTLTPVSMRDFWNNASSSSKDLNAGKGVTSKGVKKGKVKVQQSKPNVPGSFRTLGLGSRSIRPVSTNGAIGQQRPGGDWPLFKSKTKVKKGKSGKEDESATLAEAAKKKALAAAANKLRRTFLAAKKKNRSGGSSQAEDTDEVGDVPAEVNDDGNNAQDLTVPRRHPSCLEFDIDIRFSAKEWAAVGRGQGGSSNALDLPQTPALSRKRVNGMSKNGSLVGERNLGVRDSQENSGTYSDTDVSRAEPHWSPTGSSDQQSSTSTRRRHLSESSGVIDLRKNPIIGGSGSRSTTTRTRSCSMSVVEVGGSSRDNQSEGRGSRMKLHLMPRMRRLMLKQLLSMDKKSLQELVDDPRSRKAQYMMTHLMTEHRAAMSHRLAQQRFRLDQQQADTSAELHLLDTLDTTAPHSLPPDVIQQVREILALEERGGSEWEEVTLSLSDLLAAPDSDPDLDCQIISPPPRDPTSTITIHDTDSEMDDHEEDEQERDSDIEDDDPEEEEEGHDDDDDRLQQQQEEEEQQRQEQEVREVEQGERSLGKVDPSSPPPANTSKPPPAAPIPLLPQLPVEVPLCVMETLGGGPPTAQVTDNTLSLITSAPAQAPPAPPPPPLPAQRPPADGISVPGPSSLLLTPSRLKVKEERPSPVSECGLCMHPPRTPHTSECVFPYGLTPSSPVALMTGPPRPLRATTPPQRPVPHIPPPPPSQQPPTGPPLSSYQRSIKQEKLEESYLKYEHVKRPSSEERPKNPAPPDALALHAPAPGLHPPPQPRPLIFSPGNDFPDPPRPPPPPPPQFSPRIKIERHTPQQFMCCCMRNECERSSGHSAEMRPPSHRAPPTPQPPDRRPTPASHLYKMEPPSPSASHPRTPHFPPPASPRPVSTLAGDSRASVAVQTERDQLQRSVSQDPAHSNRRQYVPNLSLARSVTPLATMRVDQSTSTDDLPQDPQQHQRGKGRGKGWWWHRSGRPRNHLSQLAAISASVSEVELSGDAGVALQQLIVLGEQEAELLRHADLIHQELNHLLREKRRVADDLSRLHHIRMAKLQQLQQGGEVRPHPHDPSLEIREGGEGSAGVAGAWREAGCVQSTSEASVVSSSQEKSGRSRCLSLSHASSTDSSTEGQTVRRQRCTSTCPRPSPPHPSLEYGPALAPSNSSDNTDSDTDHEGGTMDNGHGGTSEARPAYQDVQKTAARTRMSSLSSSVEGDTESEAPGDREDVKPVHPQSLRHRMTSDFGEAVVDSSRPDSDHPDQLDQSDQPNPSTNDHLANGSCQEEENDPSISPAQHQGEEMEYAEEPMSTEVHSGLELAGDSLSHHSLQSDNTSDKSHPDKEFGHDCQNSQVCEPGPRAAQSVVEQCPELHPASPLHLIHTSSPEQPPLPPTGHNQNSRPDCNDDDDDDDADDDEEEEDEDENGGGGGGSGGGGEVVSESDGPSGETWCGNSGSSNDTSSVQVSPSDREKELRSSTSRKAFSSSSSYSSSSSFSSSPSLWGVQEGSKGRGPSSEHCYSLRSRGPPRRARQAMTVKVSIATPPTHTSTRTPRRSEKAGADQDNTDDKKGKRKRKLRKQKTNKRKKKKSPEKDDDVDDEARMGMPVKREEDVKGSITDSTPEVHLLEDQDMPDEKGHQHEEQEDIKEEEEEEKEETIPDPPPHPSAVLDMKVVGRYMLTACSDGTARCYHLPSGQVVATYTGHTDAVTCIGVLGQPDHLNTPSPNFKVVTGSADKTVYICSGQSGERESCLEVGEGVRCLDIAWGQLFLGTEGGCGARWNFKDKEVSETVQFCGQAVTSVRAMTEGGRRVLLVAAKTTPLMIRDAMTGLFLRMLEHVQSTVYAMVSHGGLLYAAGSNKAIVSYDFTSGTSLGHIPSEADVSSLSVHQGRLVATCYDGIVRVFCLKTGQLLHRIPVTATNKMLICSALYKNRLLVGNRKGEVVRCILPPTPSESK